MDSFAADGSENENTVPKVPTKRTRSRAQGGKQQCLLGAERPPTSKARRVMGQGPATLPRELASQPLPRRHEPYLPIERGHAKGAKRIARLTALLPVGAKPAKPRALERQVWQALEKRCEMEADELRVLGFSDKADTWMATLDCQREKRKQAVLERAATYRMNDFEKSTKAAKDWVLGQRLLQTLRGHPRS